MTTRLCNNAERLNDLEICSYSSLVVDNQIQHTMYISFEQIRNIYKAELSWCTLFNTFL